MAWHPDPRLAFSLRKARPGGTGRLESALLTQPCLAPHKARKSRVLAGPPRTLAYSPEIPFERSGALARRVAHVRSRQGRRQERLARRDDRQPRPARRLGAGWLRDDGGCVPRPSRE